MDDITKDKRFSHVATDPRFKKVPKSEYKVKIDKRFQTMFTDKRFQLKYSVDKRGRPVNESQADNYQKYYDLSDEEEDSDKEDGSNDEEDGSKSAEDGSDGEADGSDGEEGGSNVEEEVVDASRSKHKAKEEKKRLAKLVDEMHRSRMNEVVKERLQDMSVDYARGIGMLASESSSDEPSSDESESEYIEHPWGELDKDAEQTEEISRRLAVCHMDWDRVNAKDIMILFHSFLPAEGIIESVYIYPSEFGLARMKEEELKGPQELVGDEKFHEFDDEDFNDKHSEGSTYHMEKLREYQLKRLKYFYAVIVCNNAETANKLYTECDGMEYESSATKIDLRFIPDDMTFDQEPREVCSQLPDITKYKPRLFANSALQQGKVALTWDETDPDRIEFNKKVLSGELKDDDLQAYIAASSESDDKEESEEEAEEKETIDLDPISKYKSLLADIKEKENQKKNADEEMEISWGAGLSSKMKVAENNTSDEDSKSDEEEKPKEALKKKKREKTKNKPEEENNAELELLLAGEQGDELGKAHFNLKDIQKKEKLESKKKKRNVKHKPEDEADFKVNLSDDRFSALYTSHHFNIDPADPHFKKTKGMNEFIEEKQKRRKLNRSEDKNTNENGQLNSELSSLVRSIKNKSKT